MAFVVFIGKQLTHSDLDGGWPNPEWDRIFGSRQSAQPRYTEIQVLTEVITKAG